MMKQLFLVLALIVNFYTCQDGDTLTSVAKMYYHGGSDRREFLEFREGIKQINYDKLINGEVYPSLTVEIHTWE